MLRIERVGKRLLAFRNFRLKPIAEFYDLTDFIVNSPDEFFGEIGEKIFLVGAHARLSKSAAPVDLLGVDATGAAVAAVIESTAEESALSRAITAASRLASWDTAQFHRSLSPQRSRALQAFLGPANSRLNSRQRVFIIGEKINDEMIDAAAWLHARGVDIVFVQTRIGVEPKSGEEYLSCRALNPRQARATVDATPLFESAEPNLHFEDENDVELELAPDPDWLGLEIDEEPPVAPEPPRAAPRQEAQPQERRSLERERMTADRVVEVEYAGRRFGAHLTDHSEVGVALEMNSPLPIGSTVTVIGQVESGKGLKLLHRRGRVRYCRFEEQGFRLGIAFEQAGDAAV